MGGFHSENGSLRDGHKIPSPPMARDVSKRVQLVGLTYLLPRTDNYFVKIQQTAPRPIHNRPKSDISNYDFISLLGTIRDRKIHM